MVVRLMSTACLSRLITLVSCIALACAQRIDTLFIPTDVHAWSPILAKALDHASTRMKHHDPTDVTIAALQEGDVATLHEVAKSMNEHGDRIYSDLIWHELADSSIHHIPSMVSLGFTYMDQEGDIAHAIKYFILAGEDGPHHAATHKAGQLLAQTGEFDRAMFYLRRAAKFDEDEKTARFAHRSMLRIAKESYKNLSDELAQNDQLSLQQMIDIFPYASIDHVPQEGSQEDHLWNEAMGNLKAYLQQGKDKEILLKSQDGVTELQKFDELSDLQQILLKGILRTIFQLLNDTDEL